MTEIAIIGGSGLTTLKGLKIIFIGSDPSYRPENYLLSGDFYVVRGEPEYSLLELIENIDGDISKINGVSWLRDKKVIHNPARDLIANLDDLPFPDRTLLKKPLDYFNAKFRKFPSTTFLSSRNCSFQCYYCVPNSLSFARELEYKRFYNKKPPVSMRSPENIIEEFRQISRQGYRSVFIMDDQFVWGEERTLKILNGIRNLRMEIALLARCDMITSPRLTDAMKRAGVSHVDLGVESYNPEILAYIKKDMDVKTIDKSVSMLKKSGIEPEINILIGSCPLETKKTIRETFDKVEKLGVEIVHTKICAPFPGTEFNAVAKEKGWMLTKEYIPIDPANQAQVSYPHLTDRDLIKLSRDFYRRHYFSPGYIFRQLVKLRSPRELINKAKTGLRMWRNVVKG